MMSLYLTIVLAPLIGAILAGVFGRSIGRAGAHWATILGMSVSFACSLVAYYHIGLKGEAPFNAVVYEWMKSAGIHFEIGFLIDKLTVLMIVVVNFVSLMVHIYSIGYMRDDPGYQRFFSYISLFTFFMLMLTMSNNFLQLFFGWEGVGLVSYLLIGFWYQKESANYAALKAFLVNRVGDFGFILGIAAVVVYFNSLDYKDVFSAAPLLAGVSVEVIPGHAWSVMTMICLLLFIGAMGKSAQVPLHVWLPDSMEGPTPISALIHAATMVTAGIFMVARMSPLFELSETALSVVLVIGAITALFMALLGVVQNDIKRVIAYSTLSQLGYMTVALGVSAYSAAIFHLMTHAFFKALLFLAAGSVIIGMHHEQDIRRMGGLGKYMPITYWTALIGSLSLAGFPGFAGFFSKDAIIEAVQHSTRAGSGFAYVAVVGGVFLTALYTFRMFFLVFHGEERMDAQVRDHLHESPAVVTVPLLLLAVPSVLAGLFGMMPLLFDGFFGNAIKVLSRHDVVAELGREFATPLAFFKHGFESLPFVLTVGGIATAWLFYLRQPQLADAVKSRFSWLYDILERKYGFDELNELLFADGGRRLGRLFWKAGDELMIDGAIVNGTANGIGRISLLVRRVQSGYLYHYAFAMIIGLLLLLTVYVHGWLVG